MKASSQMGQQSNAAHLTSMGPLYLQWEWREG